MKEASSSSLLSVPYLCSTTRPFPSAPSSVRFRLDWAAVAFINIDRDYEVPIKNEFLWETA